jgi:hemoglobin-like flavoprotein
MTPEEVDLVTKSFDALWPIRRKLAGRFYHRFFELAPDSRRLFPDDMERQHLKLMDSLAAIVGALDQHEIFQSVISHTARQHARFGAAPAHFVAFREALMWSLQEQLGSTFTPEMKRAWSQLYDAVQSKMVAAAQPTPPPGGSMG